MNNRFSVSEVQVQALGAQSGMMAVFGVLAFTAVVWAKQAPIEWLRWAVAAGLILGLLTYCVLLWHSRRLIGREEEVIEFEPEAPPEAPRTPPRISSWTDGRRRLPDHGDLARFVEDCSKGTSQLALRKKWGDSVAKYRDALIENKRACWIDDQDHKRGWKLL